MKLFLHLMALFKFRKTSAEAPAGPLPAASVEELRLRAKYRLVGACILVLLGVLVFPLMFDKQPRPLPSDTPLVLLDPAKPNTLAVTPAGTSAKAVEPTAASSLDKGETVVADKPVTKPVKAAAPATSASVETGSGGPPKAEPKAAVKVPSEGNVKPEPKTDSKPKTQSPAVAQAQTNGSSDEAKRVQSLLDGSANAVAAKPEADTGRFVVQVGAFAESDRAQEVRQKIERAGMKTYTQVAQTRDGPRIRVRVGPFGQKAEAERAAEQVRKLDLPTVVLSL